MHLLDDHADMPTLFGHTDNDHALWEGVIEQNSPSLNFKQLTPSAYAVEPPRKRRRRTRASTAAACPAKTISSCNLPMLAFGSGPATALRFQTEGTPSAGSTSPPRLTSDSSDISEPDIDDGVEDRKRKHRAVEARRRYKLKSRFAMLRELVGAEKNDRGTILLSAIEKLRALERDQLRANRVIASLQSQLRARTVPCTSFDVPPARISAETTQVKVER